jgi:segregation and condensation protein A
MSHMFAVGEFEGPLGALLELVERHKLEVSVISVGQITTEYLQYVRTLAEASADDLSEFIQLGARLLYIKSFALLPQDGSQEQAGELQQLERELTEYRQFQQAAKTLGARTAGTWLHPVPQIDPSTRPFPNLSLTQLTQTFQSLLLKVPAETPEAVIKPHLSLEKVTAQLRDLAATGFNLESRLRQCRDRVEIVVTFLALLELLREGTAQVIQHGQFEPIFVGPAHV